LESGFEKDKKSLFILEGLTMYLQPESVDETFKIIREFAGVGSKVIFDYIYASVLRREHLYKGEKELYQSVFKEGEGFSFGIEKGSIDEFLAGYGLKALNIMDSTALTDMFFKDNKGKLLAMVNGTHCIVTAIKQEL
jgi:O-methyltransferase involved in polyketide biosynthesis